VHRIFLITVIVIITLSYLLNVLLTQYGCDIKCIISYVMFRPAIV